MNEQRCPVLNAPRGLAISALLYDALCFGESGHEGVGAEKTLALMDEIHGLLDGSVSDLFSVSWNRNIGFVTGAMHGVETGVDTVTEKDWPLGGESGVV